MIPLGPLGHVPEAPQPNVLAARLAGCTARDKRHDNLTTTNYRQVSLSLSLSLSLSALLHFVPFAFLLSLSLDIFRYVRVAGFHPHGQ